MTKTNPKKSEIEKHVAEKGVTKLPPGDNMDFMGWRAKSAFRTAMSRGSGNVRHSRSRWFKKGEGTV